MHWMKKQAAYRANARAVVAQIKAGEWKPRQNSISGQYMTAQRNGVRLWIGNGAFFCDLYEGPSAFGLIWRHYVWHAAAKNLRSEAELSAIPVL